MYMCVCACAHFNTSDQREPQGYKCDVAQLDTILEYNNEFSALLAV